MNDKTLIAFAAIEANDDILVSVLSELEDLIPTCNTPNDQLKSALYWAVEAVGVNPQGIDWFELANSLASSAGLEANVTTQPATQTKNNQSEHKIMAQPIQKLTLVFGQDVSKMSEADLVSAIKSVNKEIAEVEAVAKTVSSVYLNKKLAELQAVRDEIVSLLDGDEKAEAPAKKASAKA